MPNNHNIQTERRAFEMSDHPIKKSSSSQNKPDLFSDFIVNMNHLFGNKTHKGNGLLQSIDDFFMNSSQNRSFPIEMEEKDNIYLVKAKLAGVSKQQIHIEAYKQTLVITVQNQETFYSKQQTFESNHSKQIIQRNITFVKPIDEKAITAGHNNGLLEIIVPKIKGTAVTIKP